MVWIYFGLPLVAFDVVFKMVLFVLCGLVWPEQWQISAIGVICSSSLLILRLGMRDTENTVKAQTLFSWAFVVVNGGLWAIMAFLQHRVARVTGLSLEHLLATAGYAAISCFYAGLVHPLLPPA